METALLPDMLSYKLHKVVPLLSCIDLAPVRQVSSSKPTTPTALP